MGYRTTEEIFIPSCPTKKIKIIYNHIFKFTVKVLHNSKEKQFLYLSIIHLRLSCAHTQFLPGQDWAVGGRDHRLEQILLILSGALQSILSPGFRPPLTFPLRNHGYSELSASLRVTMCPEGHWGCPSWRASP